MTDMNVLYSGKDFTSILPHQKKMLLLDRIMFADTEKRELISEVDIKSSSVFFDNSINGIPSWVSFEYMAQSISALSGISGLSDSNKPKPGVILSVANFVSQIPFFKEGETLTIKVTENCKIDTVFTFDCIVYASDRTQIASAKLTVMETDSLKNLKLN